ncbi:MAG TPA: hypothetical protein VFM62_05620 [Arthrobacter sp.]|nr:hypothetical protein [Arthrobacter sp.]
MVKSLDRFDGLIAGVGSDAGIRVVIGLWNRSPFGPFTDVMLQHADGERVLLAPTQAIADYVSTIYRFDRVQVTEVSVVHSQPKLYLRAGPLSLDVVIGDRFLLGRALSLLPGRIAAHPAWLRLIDPVAARVMPGVRTAGTAGNGFREYYGVRDLHRITAISGSWYGAPLGRLRPVAPPVGFSFGSTPSQPMLATVVTSIVAGR